MSDVAYSRSSGPGWSGEDETPTMAELLQLADRLNQETPQRPQVPRGHAFALSRAIPDDPNTPAHIPIEYRLDAKQIVGEVAQDLGTRGEKAHILVEAGHYAVAVLEAITHASKAGSFLGIVSPVLGFINLWTTMGGPYLEAARSIAAENAARGFSRGVVMGADGRRPGMVRDFFENDFFQKNVQFPRGREIAMANYRMGLLVGYVNGRTLTKNQRAIFFRDLGHRMGDQSYRGPQAQWTRSGWSDWYIAIAATFRRYHL